MSQYTNLPFKDRNYMIANVDDASDPAYYGFQARNDNFYIMREGVSSGLFTYFANSSNYSDYWTSRASNTYVSLQSANI